ncbi:MAG: hypothetical protein ACU84Q_04835 [Gammaproteobacteria bacterium]
MDQKLIAELQHEARVAGISEGSEEYFVARFAPRATQNRTWCVLALKAIIENIPLRVSDPGVARLKLAWWRDINSSANHPLIEIARHIDLPIDDLLQACITLSHSLDEEYQRDAFANHALRRQWFENSFHDFYRLLGDDIALGICLEEARSLLRFRDELSANLFRLPVEPITKLGLEQQSFLEPAPPVECAALLLSELAAATTNLADALRERAERRSAVRTYAELVRRRLHETALDGGKLLERKVELTPIRKVFVAWRCSWF